MELIKRNVLRDKRAMLNRYLQVAQEIDRERTQILWQPGFESNLQPRCLSALEQLRLVELTMRGEALLQEARNEGLLHL